MTIVKRRGNDETETIYNLNFSCKILGKLFFGIFYLRWELVVQLFNFSFPEVYKDNAQVNHINMNHSGMTSRLLSVLMD